MLNDYEIKIKLQFKNKRQKLQYRYVTNNVQLTLYLGTPIYIRI